MIQILKLRKFFSKERGKEVVYDKEFEPKVNASSIRDLFENYESYVSQIKESERWNCFYTVHDSSDKKREFVSQSAIPFDIDKIGEHASAPASALLATYGSLIAQTLGLSLEDMHVVFSGHGLQFIIETTHSFDSVKYFDENREHYKAICGRINHALKLANLPGEADPSVFSPARILRMPGTLNKKPDKPVRLATLMHLGRGPVDFDITAVSGLPKVAPGEQVSDSTLRRYPRPDTKAVLQGCEFLKECASTPSGISEPLWYAMLSVTARLENGEALSHELSSGHHGYSSAETDDKISQALAASGPRTCKGINNLWGKCKQCPYFGKLESPIMIRGKDYIKTQDSGFHDIVIKDGVPRRGKPNHEDLRKFFEQQHPYVTLAGTCYAYTGTHYEEMPHDFIEGFAQEHFNPTANTATSKEFLNLLLRTNLKTAKWFEQTTFKHLNFANGILNFNSGEFIPHSPDRGFRDVLDYNYDPKATASLFEKFLSDVMGGSDDLVQLLLEFSGYCFSNDDCWLQQCLMLSGGGRNGKSTFINVLYALAGGKSKVANLTLSDIKSEVNRSDLEGRLFNMAEETPAYATIENTVFKNLVTGGNTLIKKLYKQPYSIRNRCKFIFACNDLPKSNDTTKGFLRRFVIIPFKVEFEGARDDKHLEKKLLQELPGVFNLVFSAYQRLVGRGSLIQSRAADIELEKYRLEIDTVAQWLKDNVEIDPATSERYETIENLFSSYRFFIEKRGSKPIEFIPFCRTLARSISDYDARHSRKTISGRKLFVLSGIRSLDSNNY